MASKCGRAELHPHALSQFLPQRVGPDLEQGGGQSTGKEKEEVALVSCLQPTAEHHTGCLRGARLLAPPLFHKQFLGFL